MASPIEHLMQQHSENSEAMLHVKRQIFMLQKSLNALERDNFAIDLKIEEIKRVKEP